MQSNINIFNCSKPFIISKHLGFLWGVINCDIAYLPKHVDTPLWVLKFARLLKKPLFTTIEGIDTIKTLNLFYNSLENVRCRLSYFSRIYGITDFIIKNTDIEAGLNAGVGFNYLISTGCKIKENPFNVKIINNLRELIDYEN